MAKNKFEILLDFLFNRKGVDDAKIGMGEVASSASKAGDQSANAQKKSKEETQRGTKAVKEQKTAYETLSGAVEKFAAKAKSILTGLTIGAVAAATAGIWQLTKTLKEFAGQELSETDVVSALKTMGQYTDTYRDKLIQLAGQYQKTTGIGDDMWLKAAGQLTRFGMNAGNVDNVFNALKNLTGLMDGNFQSAVSAMQRALEGEFSMFSRYGIAVETTGDKIADLNQLMLMLEQKGAGLLEARAQTLAGKWQTLQNALSDFRKEIGRTVTESSGLKDGLQWLAEKFDQLTESAQSGKLHEVLAQASETVGSWARQIADIIDQINSVEDLKVVASVVGEWIKEKLIEGGTAVAAYLMKQAPLIGLAIGQAAKSAMVGKFNESEEINRRTNQAVYGSDTPNLFKDGLAAVLGLDPKFQAERGVQKEAFLREKAVEKGESFAGTIALSDASQQSLSERIASALWESRNKSNTSNDSARLLEILEQGLSGEVLDAAIQGLELTAEDMELLAAYAENLNDSAGKTVESIHSVTEKTKQSADSAVKAADEAVKSNERIQTAMTRSGDSALQSAQVAERNIRLTEQAFIILNSLAARQAKMEYAVNNLDGQIRLQRI